MNLYDFIAAIVGALLGGGVVTLFTMPEKKMGAKLDNAQRLVSYYTNLLDGYKIELAERDARIDELQTRIEKVEKDRMAKDRRISELESQVAQLESQLEAIKQKRNKKGQFTK